MHLRLTNILWVYEQHFLRQKTELGYFKIIVLIIEHDKKNLYCESKTIQEIIFGYEHRKTNRQIC